MGPKKMNTKISPSPLYPSGQGPAVYRYPEIIDTNPIHNIGNPPLITRGKPQHMAAKKIKAQQKTLMENMLLQCAKLLEMLWQKK